MSGTMLTEVIPAIFLIYFQEYKSLHQASQQLYLIYPAAHYEYHHLPNSGTCFIYLR